MPVPGIFDRSRPCSAAIRPTTGVIRIRPVVGGGGGAGTDGSTRGGAGIGGSVVRAMWPGNPSVSSSHFGAASRRGQGRRRVRLELRQHRLDGDRLPLLDQDLRDPARGRRGDLRVHLVRGDLEQGLVLGDQFPHLHEPLHHDPFHHAFPELGHHDVDEHRFTLLAFNTRRVSGSPR